MLYLLIAMWIYSAKPEFMVMILAMIFGAHLLPFGWLYKSKIYMVMSVFVTVMTLVLGLLYSPLLLTLAMIVNELVFSVILWFEVTRLELVAE